MRSLLLALFVVPILSATVQVAGVAAQPSDTAAAEKALVANERILNEAIAKGDKATFLSLVARDGAWAGKGGFMPAILLGDALDQMSLTKWELVNPQVVWVNPTTAIVAYTWAGVGSFMGQPLAPRMIASTIWTKRGDKWMAVYHQDSDAPTQ